MPEYRRFIAYFYEYIDGKKQKNAGFAKVELRNGMWRILFRLTVQEPPEPPVQVYGFVREEGYLLGFLLGTMRAGREIAEEWAYRADAPVGLKKYYLKQLSGIRIQSADGRIFLTVWDDEAVEPDKFVLRLPEHAEPVRQNLETAGRNAVKQEAELAGRNAAEAELAGQNAAEAELAGRKTSERETETAGKNAGNQEAEPAGQNTVKQEAKTAVEKAINQEAGTTGRKAAEQKREIAEQDTAVRETGSAERKAAEQKEKIAELKAEFRKTETAEQEAEFREFMLAEQKTAMQETKTAQWETKNREEEAVSREIAVALELQEPAKVREESAAAREPWAESRDVREAAQKPNETAVTASEPERVQRQNETASPASEQERTQRPNETANAASEQKMMQRQNETAAAASEQERTQQQSKTADADSSREAVQNRKTKGAGSHYDDDCGYVERLFAGRQHFAPFRDEEIRDCVQIMPCDLMRLRQSGWQVGRSSFLQHGFFQYRHLLLGRTLQGGYVLGVPGIQAPQEQYMAQMFGFAQFKRSRICDCGKTFGYWFRVLRQPETQKTE